MSNEAPIVSVIVPCFKQARFLPECLRALQAQSLAQWEMVVVDDGSPDDAVSVATALMSQDSRVRLVQRPNGGPSAARNSGLSAMRGRYVQFVDADDILKPDKLQRHAAMLDADQTVDLVYGNAWYFDDAQPSKQVRQGFGQDPHEDWIAQLAALPMSPLLQLVQQNTMPICSPLFRRRVVDRAGPMNESMRALEDWEFWIRCANSGAEIRFDPAPEAECLIRLHPTSASQDRDFMLGAELSMRITCMDYLNDKKARRLMLAGIGRLLSWREGEGRAATYRRLQPYARGTEERAALWVAANLGPGTRLHRLARPLIERMPWHIRALAAA